MTQKKTTELRKEEIIEAALGLVEQSGIDSLSIADIANAINLVPSAIYRHFQSKEAIIQSIIEYVGKILNKNILYVLKNERETQKRLKLLLDFHFQFVGGKRIIPQILFSVLGSNKNLFLKQEMVAITLGYVEAIKNIIAEGQSKDEIAADIDPNSAALLFFGLIQPQVIFNQNSNAPIENYQDTSWQIYWKGISQVS